MPAAPREPELDCNEVRTAAVAFADPMPVIRDWSGEPIPVDWVGVSDDEKQRAFRLRSDAIHILTRQLGYAVVREGSWVEEPILDDDVCDGWHRQGHITAYVHDDEEPNPALPNTLVTAGLRCARVKFWNGTMLDRSAMVLIHELSHLMGLTHNKYRTDGSLTRSVSAPGKGWPMSSELTDSRALMPEDIAALRCIMPFLN